MVVLVVLEVIWFFFSVNKGWKKGEVYFVVVKFEVINVEYIWWIVFFNWKLFSVFNFFFDKVRCFLVWIFKIFVGKNISERDLYINW